MEKIEELKSLINQLEIKLEELKNEITSDEITVSRDEFDLIELITDDEHNHYLKFKEFRFWSRKYKTTPPQTNTEIVQDIKNGKLKSFKLKKNEIVNEKSKLGLNSYISDVTRTL